MKQLFKRSRIAATCLMAMGLTSNYAMAEDDAMLIDSKSNAVQFTLITGEVVTAVVRTDGTLGGIRLMGENGTEVITSVFQNKNGQYIISPKAQKLVDSRTVDMELFNITKLHAAGYDDASTDKLPVIIEYQDGTLAGSAVPNAIEGATLTDEIELIDSASFGISKDKAAQVIESLSNDMTVKAVWLDAVIKAEPVTSSGVNALANLKPTVPLTGAYGNLANKYNGKGVLVAVLDTGYDTEHPDLAGQVLVSKDFSYSSNGVDDLNSHGTHTASTIAGTGHESDGLYAGMAPGAKLLVGKVLSNSGSGSTTGILNGMIWAVNQGADIVSMSLGGSGTSCQGPLVDMVEALSDKALFVISAGNSFTRESVGIPGCAPSALTVGAADRENNTATFSSRGPSPDGHSAKPDITSQGVDVIAAASGGNGDTAYRAMSGTSMSAPHVAGGAAIVMEARPDLTPRQVKEVLTSSVLPTDAHVLEQGAGPMDVNRAVGQSIIAPPNMELGSFAYDQDIGVTQTQVTLTNVSNKDVTLKLKMSLIGEDGKTQMPATLAGLGVKSIVVPANGTADVPVWIDSSVALRSGAYGAITGRIEGTTTGKTDVHVTVPVSFWIQQPEVNLSLNVTDMRGKPAASPSKVYLMNEEDDWGQAVTLTNGQANLKVPEGNYTIVANVMTYDNDTTTTGLVESAAQMAVLNRKVSQDTHLEFDARNAEKLEFKASKPLAPQGYSFGFTYALDDNKLAKLAAMDLAPDYVKEMYTWSQGHDDRFRSFVTTRAFAPETVLKMQNGEVLDYNKQGLAMSFNGEGSAEVVFVGDGGYSTKWADYDLQGRIALIGNPYYFTSTMVNSALKNGAIGVIFYRPGMNGRYKGTIGGTPRIPAVAVSSEQGEALLAEVQAGNNVVSWKGIAAERTPYAYSINHITDGHINGGQVVLQEQKMNKIQAAYHSQNDERPVFVDVMAMTNSTGEFYSTGSTQMVMTPVVRDEYYTATTKNMWTNLVMPGSSITTEGAYFDGPRMMTEGGKETTTWLKGPKAGSQLSNGGVIAYRDTNTVGFSIVRFGDASGHDGTTGYNAQSLYGLKVNGVNSYLDTGKVTLPDSNAQVELEIRSYPRGVGSSSPIKDNLGSFYQGIYTFNTDSGKQGAQAVLVPKIDVPVAIDNTLPAGEPAMVKLAGLMDGIGQVDLSDVTLEYGYGQECSLTTPSVSIYCPVSTKFAETSWQVAEVKQINGEWVATIPNSTVAGNFVHLRVQMKSDDSSVKQTMMRVYMLK
ncbi:S8 family serine peptidase [Shewanella acanthi]|uniref:S8 family serine peptidase n=1 Tax=Shewanella acanthi TaxID=2864212 RepID=UPI001C65E45E|nr:S8 family serine peptidase [Shewanella acanthi]QYJ80217.1 S8 family serine peptidase [Shewanella acanthi]